VTCVQLWNQRARSAVKPTVRDYSLPASLIYYFDMWPSFIIQRYSRLAGFSADIAVMFYQPSQIMIYDTVRWIFFGRMLEFCISRCLSQPCLPERDELLLLHLMRQVVCSRQGVARIFSGGALPSPKKS